MHVLDTAENFTYTIPILFKIWRL